jgi:hypothetical protein
MIAAAMLLLAPNQPFPGWRALLPTVGTYLLIASGPSALVNRTVLSLRPLIWVGLISYPLYLWHWPLLSFAHLLDGYTPPRVRLALVGLAFVLAWGTYRWVEKPLRFGRLGNRRVISSLLVSLAGLAVVGTTTMAARGFPVVRGPWNVVNIGQTYERADRYTERCLEREAKLFVPDIDREREFCHESGTDAGHPDIVVVGDSHANRLYAGIAALGSRSIVNLGRATCPPFDGFDGLDAADNHPLHCSPTMGHLLDRTVELAPRVAILNAFFSRSYDGRIIVRRGAPFKEDARESLVRLARGVQKLIIAFDVPELPFYPSVCVDRPLTRAVGRGHCEFPRLGQRKQLALYENDLRDAARGLANVSFFDPADVLCTADTCAAIADDNLLYDDPHHLSRYGALLVARALKPQLE